eukprot:3502002-Amphidinium_carterae.1
MKITRKKKMTDTTQDFLNEKTVDDQQNYESIEHRKPHESKTNEKTWKNDWSTRTTARLDRNEPLPRPHHQRRCSGTTDDYYAYDQRHGNRSRHKGYSATSTTTVLKLNYYLFGYYWDNNDVTLSTMSIEFTDAFQQWLHVYIEY